MRKRDFLILVIFCFLLSLWIYGCGTATAPSGGVSTALVNKSKAGALFASSGSGMSQVASGIGSSSQVSQVSLTAVASGPPDSFFEPLTNTDGYVTVEGFHTGETVKIRYITQGSSPVTPSFLSGKKIGKLGDYNWDNIFTGTGPETTQEAAFVQSQTYEVIDSLADYIVWSGIIPQWGPPGNKGTISGIPLATPEATTSQKVGAMEGSVTMAGNVTGTMSINMTCSTSEAMYAAPTGATGSGTLEVGSETLTATMEVTFSQGSPTQLIVIGTTADNYTVSITCGAGGSGTGTVTDNNGTKVADIVITASGEVTVTDNEGNTTTY